ncbi:hypothetical protein [Novosphingobium sp.]|uniref:hypothetical protein n=1 Tax=Novosphingobium sp. TaxID=1874826 RepID=UPI00286E773A|nr:hypothetical protein [Novosphingobium sp.]
MANLSSPHIVIIGNPVDGFTHYGPFADWEAATDWVESLSDCDWWIAPLEPADPTPV